jgi:hypothetical protein
MEHTVSLTVPLDVPALAARRKATVACVLRGGTALNVIKTVLQTVTVIAINPLATASPVKPDIMIVNVKRNVHLSVRETVTCHQETVNHATVVSMAVVVKVVVETIAGTKTATKMLGNVSHVWMVTTGTIVAVHVHKDADTEYVSKMEHVTAKKDTILRSAQVGAVVIVMVVVGRAMGSVTSALKDSTASFVRINALPTVWLAVFRTVLMEQSARQDVRMDTMERVARMRARKTAWRRNVSVMAGDAWRVLRASRGDCVMWVSYVSS